MKFCYCDESGTGAEPYAVMAGVIVDAQRMHRTKDDWDVLLRALSARAGRAISEFHTRDFVAGNSPWREIAAPERRQVERAICDWLVDRKHNLIATGVQKDIYVRSQGEGIIPAELNTPWRFMGFHLALSIQRAHQQMQHNKGHTLLVFDSEERERMRYTDIIRRPQAWSDEYYERTASQEALDQIIDVPYFGDSREVGLIQVADFVAFFLRRHIELTDGGVAERYVGEAVNVAALVGRLSSRMIDGRHVFPRRNRSAASEKFWIHAPSSLKAVYG